MASKSELQSALASLRTQCSCGGGCGQCLGCCSDGLSGARDTLAQSMWGPLAGQVDEWLEAQLGGVSQAEGTVTSAISSIEAELAEIAAREEQERREAEEEARREAEEQTDVPPGMFE